MKTGSRGLASYRDAYLNSTQPMRIVHRHYGGLSIPALIQSPEPRKPYAQRWREAEATAKKKDKT